MYTRLTVWIVTDKIGEYFGIEERIEQRDPFSSMLFIAALKEI